jgi:hypothetical protein
MRGLRACKISTNAECSIWMPRFSVDLYYHPFRPCYVGYSKINISQRIINLLKKLIYKWSEKKKKKMVNPYNDKLTISFSILVYSLRIFTFACSLFNAHVTSPRML